MSDKEPDLREVFRALVWRFVVPALIIVAGTSAALSAWAQWG